MCNLIENPEWQRKLHEEIDRVTENGRRFLEWEDRTETPIFMACMAESARFRPIVTVSAPHVCSKDTVLDGRPRRCYRACASNPRYRNPASYPHLIPHLCDV